ncbi:MAG: hypothetical protein JW840_02915 [Candidatus Thermoplasmatota archaeon]|nr:hypothetical protein [Candidatus Thermoplasmatota archaeon]
MKREDVELVLLKSFEYFKSLLCADIDLGAVQRLTEYVWGSIKEDQAIDAQVSRVCLVTRRQLHRLVTQGVYGFKDIYGHSIELRFEDRGEPPFILESGAIYLTKEHFTTFQKEEKKHSLNKKAEKMTRGRRQTRIDDFITPFPDKKPKEQRRKGL